MLFPYCITQIKKTFEADMMTHVHIFAHGHTHTHTHSTMHIQTQRQASPLESYFPSVL